MGNKTLVYKVKVEDIDLYGGGKASLYKED